MPAALDQLWGDHLRSRANRAKTIGGSISMTKITLLSAAAALLVAFGLVGCDNSKGDAAGGASAKPTTSAAATAKPTATAAATATATATATAAADSGGDVSCEQMFDKLEKIMKAAGAPATPPDEHKKELEECKAGKEKAPAEFKAAADCIMKLDETKPDFKTCDALMEKLDKASK